MFILVGGSRAPTCGISLRCIDNAGFSCVRRLPGIGGLGPFSGFALGTGFIVCFGNACRRTSSRVLSGFPSLVRGAVVQLGCRSGSEGGCDCLLVVGRSNVVRDQGRVWVVTVRSVSGDKMVGGGDTFALYG